MALYSLLLLLLLLALLLPLFLPLLLPRLLPRCSPCPAPLPANDPLIVCEWPLVKPIIGFYSNPPRSEIQFDAGDTGEYRTSPQQIPEDKYCRPVLGILATILWNTGD